MLRGFLLCNIKYSMRTRIIAVTELAFIFPAALFMTALLLRNLLPLQHEPARSAQQLIMWYAGRTWTLWLLLLALPFIVLIIGCVALVDRWNDATRHTGQELLAKLRWDVPTLVITATTVAAGIILAIVVLHMLAN
jgi:hypothetical protein